MSLGLTELALRRRQAQESSSLPVWQTIRAAGGFPPVGRSGGVGHDRPWPRARSLGNLPRTWHRSGWKHREVRGPTGAAV